MKTMDQVKKRIITSMVSILLLIITLFGITYAYFIANVRGNDEKKSITAKAGKLELTYGDGNGVLEVGEFLQPGNTVKFKNSNNEIVEQKTFTVTNTGTATVPSYEVILQNVVNELEYYEDLTYTLTCTSYINYGEDTQEISGTCDGNEDTFPKTNGLLAINSIDEGVTHYYVLKLHYAETNTDQSNDMKKNIVAKINIQDDESSLKSMLIYGNSVQEGTPTETTPVAIQSVGEKMNFMTTEYRSFYGEYVTKEEDGWLHIEVDNTSGAATKWVNFWPARSDELIEGETYTFVVETQEVSGISTLTLSQSRSNDIPQFNNELQVTDISPNSRYFVSTSYNQPNGSYLARTFASIPAGSIGKMKVRISLLKGEINENNYNVYEPYGYKIPIKVTGKNLINIDSIEFNSTSAHGLKNLVKTENSFSYETVITPISNGAWLKNVWLSAGTYRMKGSCSCTSGHSCGFILTRDGVITHNYGANGMNNKFTITDSNYYDIGFYKGYSVPIGSITTFSNIQLEKGSTSTKYEPYKESVYNIYLDAPLRKVGDYVDYIDFANRKVVRNVGVADDSGTKPIEESLYGLTRPIQENIDVPLLTKESIGRLEILTEVEPSKLEY